MERKLDFIDVCAVLILAVSMSLWSVIWAHPYPHPDMWGVLSTLRYHASLSLFTSVGHVAVGVVAALSYLVTRQFWMMRLGDNDDPGAESWCVRVAPFCGAITFVCLPPIWRAGQFFSPSFLALAVSLLAAFFWMEGRGYRRRIAYFIANLLFGFAAALTIINFLILLFVLIFDVVCRSRTPEDDLAEGKDTLLYKNSLESVLALGGTLAGIAAGVAFAGCYCLVGTEFWTLPLGVAYWFENWIGTFEQALVSPFVLAVSIGISVTVVGIETGRRVYLSGINARIISIALTAVIVGLSGVFVLRSVDVAERERLGVIRDYVRALADDLEGVTWFFTDGRFDDILRFELAQVRRSVALLDTSIVPSERESRQLRLLAPSFAERDVFAMGGGEVFQAWVRERSDRLLTSAWQLGGSATIAQMKVLGRTCGTVLRTPDAAVAHEKSAASDARFVALSERLAPVVERLSRWGSLLGGTDGAVARKFDEILCCAARMALARMERHSVGDDAKLLAHDRDLAERLDSLNMMLLHHGEVSEKKLPTHNLVLTSRECLLVALERRDYDAAGRYARDVLVVSPDDVMANYALGRAYIAHKDMYRASRHLEIALKGNPEHVEALDAMAQVYLDMDDIEKALPYAELAVRLSPQVPEHQELRTRIRDEVRKKKASKGE